MENEFLGEAEDLVDNLSKGLLCYEKALEAGAKVNPDMLNNIFRTAHTLKGVAGVFGHQEMSKLAHAMENLLSRIRLGQMSVSQSVLDILFEAVDKLEAMLAAKAPNSVKIESLLQKLNQAAEAQQKDVEQNNIAVKVDVPERIKRALTEYEEFRLAENLRSDLNVVIVMADFTLGNFDTMLPKLTDWLKKQGEIIATLPGDGGQDDQGICFQILFATAVNLERLSRVLKSNNITLKILKRG